MVSFDNFIMEDGVPIYQQIILYIKQGIASLQFKDGEELPSRRTLSARLGVNPNTCQKAYKLLEEEGLIESRSGAKSYISVTEKKSLRLKEELLKEDVRSTVVSLKQAGLSLEEAVSILNEMWEEQI